jgi:putative oxidoreductase
MKRVFGSFVAGRGGVGLLLVRLVFGLALMLHGWQKIQSPGGPMGWMGPDAPVPGVLQGLATLSEFGGGLAFVVGLLTPLAALGVVCTMLFAILMVHLKAGQPFVGAPGKPSFESPAGYLAVALLLLITGPGTLSLDALLWGKNRRSG